MWVKVALSDRFYSKNLDVGEILTVVTMVTNFVFGVVDQD